MSAKKAIILLGGRGTRISRLFPDTPKALIPVSGKPFLAWQVDWLFKNKISSIALAAGYLGDKIQDWTRQQPFKENISVMIEPKPLGTGGALKFAARAGASESFWVLNGDSLLPELDFQKMAENHGKSGTPGTIAVTKIKDAGRYGTVIFDDNGKIVRFDEKGRETAGWINGGVYLLNSSILSEVQADKTVSLEHDIFPRLAASGKLSVFQSSPPLLDMGTPEGLTTMETYLLPGLHRISLPQM